MSEEASATTAKAVSHKRLFVLSVAVPSLAIAISNTILNLLLLEIASTFNVNEGIAAQLRTINAAAEVIIGLLMGFLAVRFRHKSLLLVGLIVVAVSAVGTFFAPTLSLMLFFSFLEGSGTVMIAVMAFTLIGNSLSLDEKAKAVSWIVAAGFLSTLAGTPTINLIADVGGWRYAFLLFVLPVSMAGLVLASFGIPSLKSDRQKSAIGKGIYFRNFKQVFLNRSAVSCLVGSLFFTGTGSALFVVAFLRQQFSLSREYSVYVILFVALIMILGSLVTGRIVNKFGPKFLTVLGAFGNGVLTIMMFFAPNLWTVLILSMLQTWFMAMAISAYPCLALDQVPKSRGTMVSMLRVFSSIGGAITPAVGGTLLVLFSPQSLGIGYQAVGLAFGAMNIIAAAIIYFLALDPNRT